MPVDSERLATICIDKEYLKFSAAHFTIFSATERERLHGHNFSVSAEITATVDDNGMTSNYRVYKDALKRCCLDLDEYLILAGDSPYLRVQEQGSNYLALFNSEELIFAKNDTKVLPLKNTTVEEFSYFVLQQLLQDKTLTAIDGLKALTVTVASGPGQTGSSSWQK